MKRLVLASALVSLLCFMMPLTTYAASKPTFFGPIVPAECKCTGQKDPASGNPITTAPDFGCVLQVAQNSVNFAITFASLLFTIYIVIAAIQFITRGDNSEDRSKARTRLTNVVVGLAVMLTAWLVVDYIMKTIYDSTSYFGPWNSILAGKSDKSDRCIVATKPAALFSGSLTVSSTADLGTTVAGGGNVGYTGSGLSYQSEVQKQIPNESGPLSNLLACMAGKLPSGVGQISAISEKAIADGTKTMAQCAASGCAHTANSCHYGGRNCTGKSYAVDFGDEGNAAAIRTAARSCDTSAKWNYEGNHVHISVGDENNCSCDSGLQAI